MSSMMISTPIPMMTHVSIERLKSICPPPTSKLVCDSTASNHVEITDDSFRLAVPQKNFAIAGLDPHTAIAPDVCAAIAEAANSVSANHVPAVGNVAADVGRAKGTYAEAERKDVKATGTK